MASVAMFLPLVAKLHSLSWQAGFYMTLQNFRCDHDVQGNHDGNDANNNFKEDN